MLWVSIHSLIYLYKPGPDLPDGWAHPVSYPHDTQTEIQRHGTDLRSAVQRLGRDNPFSSRPLRMRIRRGMLGLGM